MPQSLSLMLCSEKYCSALSAVKAFAYVRIIIHLTEIPNCFPLLFHKPPITVVLIIIFSCVTFVVLKVT